MGKHKASPKPVVTQASAASVLPKPNLVGAQAPVQKPIEEAGPGPTPKHDPTLIGLPKHLPTALPPVKAKGLAAQGKESSLVGLSRQLVSSPRPHKTGIRLKSPTPPPSAATPPANRRHAADATDYDVQIIGAYATPPLPARASHEPSEQDVGPSEQDVTWDDDHDDDAQVLIRGSRRNTFLTAGAIAVLCAAAIAISAYTMRTPDAKPLAARATPKAQVTETMHAAAAPAPAQAVAAPASAHAPAPLSADLIAGAPKSEHSASPLAAKPAKLSKKALLRKRAHAQRTRLGHRPAQRKVAAKHAL